MILISSNSRKDRGSCRIVAPNFELSPFLSTLSRTLTICLQSGKTATVAVVGTEGLSGFHTGKETAYVFLSLRADEEIFV